MCVCVFFFIVAPLFILYIFIINFTNYKVARVSILTKWDENLSLHDSTGCTMARILFVTKYAFFVIIATVILIQAVYTIFVPHCCVLYCMTECYFTFCDERKNGNSFKSRQVFQHFRMLILSGGAVLFVVVVIVVVVMVVVFIIVAFY